MNAPIKNDRIARLIEWQKFVLTDAGRSEFLQRCEEVGDLGEVCRQMDLKSSLVVAFLAMHKELDGRAKRALEWHTHRIVAEAVEITDSPTVLTDPETGETVDSSVKRDSLRAKIRIQAAGLWNRRDYGQQTKVTHEHTFDLGEQLRRAIVRERGTVHEQAEPSLPLEKVEI